MNEEEDYLTWEDFDSYADQLRHKNWYKKRAEIISIYKVCQSCGTSDCLQVHHKRYIYGRLAWEYVNSDLELLCVACHAKEHGKEELTGIKKIFYRLIQAVMILIVFSIFAIYIFVLLSIFWHIISRFV